MINTNKLRGRMAEKGMTQEDLADTLNITPPTLSRKINNKVVITLPEVFSICKTLDIKNDDFWEYFFAG